MVLNKANHKFKKRENNRVNSPSFVFLILFTYLSRGERILALSCGLESTLGCLPPLMVVIFITFLLFRENRSMP